MKKGPGLLLGLALLLAVVPAQAEEVTFTGEVLDLACYVGRGAKGADHAGCAKSCVKGGQPMGLLTEDGKVAISGSFDEEVNFRVWDTRTGAQKRAIKGHFARVDSVVFVYRASYALTSSAFSPYISLWDLDMGISPKSLTAAGFVSTLAVTPDGSRAVSLGQTELSSQITCISKCLMIIFRQ